MVGVLRCDKPTRAGKRGAVKHRLVVPIAGGAWDKPLGDDPPPPRQIELSQTIRTFLGLEHREGGAAQKTGPCHDLSLATQVLDSVREWEYSWGRSSRLRTSRRAADRNFRKPLPGWKNEGGSRG